MELTQQDREAQTKAMEASQLIENPLLLEALATMEQHIFELWRDASLTADQREELHRQQMTLNRFVGLIDLYVQGGAQARSILGLDAPAKTFFQRIKEFL